MIYSNYDGKVKYASDYLPEIKKYAETLIKSKKAYVDDSSSEDIAKRKGSPGTPGENAPNRDLSVEENMALWSEMESGKLKAVLRAKIDMSHANLIMRDPVIYRVIEGYGLYPMYDFAHPLSDYIEEISHSLCTLEFEDHRPLYEWVLNNLDLKGRLPRQIEFSRLNLSHAITSKRKTLKLMSEGVVSDLDDPRLPTISGLRNRGYTASAIRAFCEKVGVTKFNGITEYSLLEHCLREEMNKTAPRVMAVSEPLKVEIEGMDTSFEVEVENNPEDESAGVRKIMMSNEIWIEKEDFRLDANSKYYRLKPGGAVRLKGGVIIECVGYSVDENGNPFKVMCKIPDEPKKVKSTIHWVDSNDGISVEIREYDNLFNSRKPGEGTGDFIDDVNLDSLKIFNGFCESYAASLEGGVQFLRKGYYFKVPGAELAFNKTVGLRSSFKE